MVTDAVTVTRQSQTTYKTFCQFFMEATFAVIALMCLMALFLL